MKRTERIIANILLVICTIGILYSISRDIRQYKERNRIRVSVSQPQTDTHHGDSYFPYFSEPTQETEEPVFST